VAVYVLRRLTWLPFHLLIVSFFTFAIARLGPGDPISAAAGQNRDPEVLARLRAELGFDDHIVEQYWHWLQGVVQGDFGQSFLQQGFTVWELIQAKLWISAQLNIVALIMVFGIGVPLGLLAARANGTWIDPIVISTLLFLQAIPVLVLIPPLLWLFALKLDLLPVGGWGGIFEIYWIGGVVAVPIPDPHLYLPVFVMSIGGFAGIARLVRITALEVLTEDYVRTARAKGLPEFTVAVRHVLPNSLLPVVTVVGFAMIGILSGSFFVELLFGINGIGRFLFEAVRSRDYDVILAMTVIVSAAFVLVNLLTELSYAFIDPRIRLGEESST
jgi:ABC-type dipeptide/oligopeptide/nickel transport system permease component